VVSKNSPLWQEFSAFDMVIGRAASLSTPEYFDVATASPREFRNKRPPEERNPGIKAFHLKRRDEALVLPFKSMSTSMHFPTPNPHGSASGMHKMTTLSKMAWVVVPSVSQGPSYGRGQTEPGELQNNKANTQVTDELLADESFQHLICFANVIFWIFTHVFELTTTKEEKSEQAEEVKTRWQEGVAMYSTVDSLQS
ncbi:hypothetical protein B0H13DRAFT_1932152, partial [Mycena leptocephala]